MRGQKAMQPVYPAVAVASISTSAMWILTRSPMETRPTNRSLSTTGMWRNRRAVISDISQLIVSASRAVTPVLVMKSETGSFKTWAPHRLIARMRSCPTERDRPAGAGRTTADEHRHRLDPRRCRRRLQPDRATPREDDHSRSRVRTRRASGCTPSASFTTAAHRDSVIGEELASVHHSKIACLTGALELARRPRGTDGAAGRMMRPDCGPHLLLGQCDPRPVEIKRQERRFLAPRRFLSRPQKQKDRQ